MQCIDEHARVTSLQLILMQHAMVSADAKFELQLAISAHGIHIIATAAVSGFEKACQLKQALESPEDFLS